MTQSDAGAEELWKEAIADSGLDVAKLHRFDAVRAVIEGAGAQWWPPEVSVHEPPVSLSRSCWIAAGSSRQLKR